jgi:hypothetical protein
MAKVTIPSSLITHSPSREKRRGSGSTVDFDDDCFAHHLRDGYRSLSGSWFRRAFSARKLGAIRLGQVSPWSGNAPSDSHLRTSRPLAAGAGLDMDADTKNPFTEDGFMHLYRRPMSGKARYTWVHWARRISASNVSQPPLWTLNNLSTRSSHRRARSLDTPSEKVDPVSHPFSSSTPASVPDTYNRTIRTVAFDNSCSARPGAYARVESNGCAAMGLSRYRWDEVVVDGGE